MSENTQKAELAERAEAEQEVQVMPLVDIEETEEAFVVTADMPGLKLEDINVQLDKDILIVEAPSAIEGFSKVRYQRKFRVQRGLDPDKVQADYKQGVLKLMLPKPVAQKSQKIKINCK